MSRVWNQAGRYRPLFAAIETDTALTLEVVDYNKTGHVWDEQFRSDAEARDVAVKAIVAEGALAFMRGNIVIPLRQA